MVELSEDLENYRNGVENVFQTNIEAITCDRRCTLADRVVTASHVAAYCMSHAAFFLAANDPLLKNAPIEEQIDDFLELIRDTMVENAAVQRAPRVLLALCKPGAEVGRQNRTRVREWLTAHLGGSNRECAKALGLSEVAVGRHVRALRAEWGKK